MFKSQIKAGAVSAIALAMTVGLAAPASAVTYSLTADKEVVRNGQGVVFTTNAPGENLAAFFVDGEFWGNGLVSNTPNPFEWTMMSPCASVDATYRVYDTVAPVEDESQQVDWADSYAGSVTVRFVGDNSGECDDTWGPGKSSDDSDEPLAKTGSDASAVAGLTGVAGVVGLAVAAAVALRTRRAQR